MKSENNEKILLEGLAASEKKAIEAIYRENFNMVQSLVINNNGSADDAKDVFQETMIVLYEKVRSGSFELHCQIKTYIYSVSRRLWLKRLNQLNRYSPPAESLEHTVPVEDEIEDVVGLELTHVHVDQVVDVVLRVHPLEGELDLVHRDEVVADAEADAPVVLDLRGAVEVEVGEVGTELPRLGPVLGQGGGSRRQQDEEKRREQQGLEPHGSSLHERGRTVDFMIPRRFYGGPLRQVKEPPPARPPAAFVDKKRRLTLD